MRYLIEMESLIIATHNINKTREFAQMAGCFFDVKDLHDIGCVEEIPETGATLKANARLKADFVSRTFGCNCLADDTGLEIDALDGAPGVFSARFAGEAKDASQNIRKVLEMMEGQKNRKARFRTVIALIWDGQEHCFEGIVEGEILSEPIGTGGFGYDAIFRPAGSPFSFAQMEASEKNVISHRAKAFQQFIQFINNQFRHV